MFVNDKSSIPLVHWHWWLGDRRHPACKKILHQQSPMVRLWETFGGVRLFLEI